MHVQGQDRYQATLFPKRLDELIGEDNPVRVIDAFVDSLDLKALGLRASRRLEHESHKNVEVLCLLNRLAPDHKTIAKFRVDNRLALTRVCRAFVQFCRSQAL